MAVKGNGVSEAIWAAEGHIGKALQSQSGMLKADLRVESLKQPHGSCSIMKNLMHCAISVVKLHDIENWLALELCT